jgi:hypothetical protein
MAKTLTDALPQVSISWLKQQGYFKYGTAPLLTGISFTSTNCYFGGKRFWFLCICRRRAGVLYEFQAEFRCRKCLDLAYPAQNIRKSIRNDVMLSAFDDFLEAQDLQKEAKRFTYAGKPTKKQLKISKLYLNFYKVGSVF